MYVGGYNFLKHTDLLLSWRRQHLENLQDWERQDLLRIMRLIRKHRVKQLKKETFQEATVFYELDHVREDYNYHIQVIIDKLQPDLQKALEGDWLRNIGINKQRWQWCNAQHYYLNQLKGALKPAHNGKDEDEGEDEEEAEELC